MKHYILSSFLKLFIFLKLFFLAHCLSLFVAAQINPINQFDSLFIDVQLNSVFVDQKKFPDCIPKYNPDTILKKYQIEKKDMNFNLKSFIGENFDTNFVDTLAILYHIDHLWDQLTRQPELQNEFSSLISLPEPYIVPGGRFREIYYWDSYFTMLGLEEAGKYELIENMIDNFSYLINKYGYVPNGNRTYYLSRSQPPFYSLMIDILAKHKGNSVYIKYLKFLEKEYNFWMNDKDLINNNFNIKERVVLLKEKDILNRYWDSLTIPRPEAYKMDYEIFLNTGRNHKVYKDIRATAESGWDFSSRWFKDSVSLKFISTTEIIPVDLNCLLYHLEITLSKAYQLSNYNKMAEIYKLKAETRKRLINKYCWDENSGFFFDYNFIEKKLTYKYTLAGMYPLFFEIADSNQAIKVANIIDEYFVKSGGLVTTLINSGEQWDYPNGWAPLQWISYMGLKNYGINTLANTIAKKWLSLNMKVFFETGKMMEKYNVVDLNKPGGGGEYELQDGFGWTNAVFLKFWKEINQELN